MVVSESWRVHTFGKVNVTEHFGLTYVLNFLLVGIPIFFCSFSMRYGELYGPLQTKKHGKNRIN